MLYAMFLHQRREVRAKRLSEQEVQVVVRPSPSLPSFRSQALLFGLGYSRQGQTGYVVRDPTQPVPRSSRR